MRKCKDHLGQDYPSQNKMCKKYGISSSLYSWRIKNKWSIEAALTTSQDDKNITYDHLGKKYETQKKMCEKYQISENTYRYRRSRGLSVGDALTMTSDELEKYRPKIKDHLGNEFASKQKMLDHYGIDFKTFQDRMDNKKWSLAKSLTTETNKVVVKDHLGEIYENQEKMCTAYGISLNMYRYKRYGLKMSVEDSLTMPVEQLVKISDRVGEKVLSSAGQMVEIINANSQADILIKFEDGTLKKSSYSAFSKGNINNDKLDTGYNHVRIAYKLDDGTVGLYCRCRKCGKKYIGTWKDVYAHVCKNDN